MKTGTGSAISCTVALSKSQFLAVPVPLFHQATDSIVAEVRRAREALAQRFNYDLRAMIQDARERQAAGGRQVVSFPPKPARQTAPLHLPNQGMQPTGMADPK